EVDAAVVVEPERIVGESEHGLRALLVAITRGTQRLALVHQERLPAELGSLDPPALPEVEAEPEPGLAAAPEPELAADAGPELAASVASEPGAEPPAWGASPSEPAVSVKPGAESERAASPSGASVES